MNDPYRERAPSPLSDAEAHARLSQELGPGEALVWVGRPPGRVLFVARDWLGLPFTLVWLGFSLVWMAGAARAGAPLPMLLFGVPFVAIGVYLTVGRFFYEAWQRRRTLYGVTTERALFLEGSVLRSLELRGADLLVFEDHGGGAGTISFGDPVVRKGQPKPPQFTHIANARDVYVTLREQRAALERVRVGGPLRPATGDEELDEAGEIVAARRQND